MKFYRRLPTIKAMTFDLDDTLYDNRPIIRQLELHMAKWLHQAHPVSATQPMSWWHKVKRDVLTQTPWLSNDVTEWRYQQIQTGLQLLGYSEEHASLAAAQAIEEVLRLRSDFDVPQSAHEVLLYLSERVPLVAITNGNVDVERIGLSRYFSLVLKAGPDGFAKPHRDMFDKAAAFLTLPADSILHVGDHLLTDVQGAKNSGFNACWFNDQSHELITATKARALPDIEIHRLDQLKTLVD